MEFSNLNIIKNSYIFSKESISYISENGTLHFSAHARKVKEIFSWKIYYTSGNEDPPKKLLYFLYFRKWNFWVQSWNFFLIFQDETYIFSKRFYIWFSSSEFSLSETSEEISMFSVIKFLIDFFFSLTTYLHPSKSTWA